MKTKKIPLGIIYLLALIISVVNISFFIYDQLYFNMADLPSGEKLYSSMSPDGDKTVCLYKVKGIKSDAIRGELVTFDEDTGTERTENIFWSTGYSNAITGWYDNEIVTINDIALNLSNGDTYDSRRKISLTQKI